MPRLSGSLEVVGTVMDQLATYDFLLVICSNHGPIFTVSEIISDIYPKFFHSHVFNTPLFNTPLR